MVLPRPQPALNRARSRRAVLPFIALAAVVFFAFLAGRYYFVSGDDGTYIAMARSVALGDYRAINVPGAPAQTQYPPLFPLILLPVSSLPLPSIRFWVALLSLSAAVAVVLAARLRDLRLGALGAVPFLVSPIFGEYSTTILTESIFIALAYGVIVQMRHRISEGTRGVEWPLALALIAALYLRSAALGLFGATIGFLLWKRRFRTAISTAFLVLLGLAPWWLWQQAHGGDYVRGHILVQNIYLGDSPLLKPWELITDRAPYNLVRYVGRIVVDVLIPPFFRDLAPWTAWFPVKVAVSTGLAAFGLYGCLRLVRTRGASLEEWYVGATMLLLLVHPVFADRYLYPMLPSLIGYFLYGFADYSWRKRCAIAWAVLLVAGIVLALAKPVLRVELAYLEAVDWLTEHSEPDAVVLARKPTTVWYHAGRRSTGYPQTGDYTKWGKNFDYLVRDEFVIGVSAAEMYVDPVVRENPCLEPVFTASLDTGVRIFRHWCGNDSGAGIP